MNKKLVILGIRGVPAAHGGFETFAEYLCKYLVKKDWNITVYCQEDGAGETYESEWEGVRRIHVPIKQAGPLGTIIFDLKSVWHARKNRTLHLTLGYNTACFNIVQRVMGITNVINMDGIEWKRQKWGKVAKTWFWLNEHLGCWFGNYLIADHPKIENHLATRVSRKKITMIPYGAKEALSADSAVLSEYKLENNKYAIVIARPEPENSLLEIVKAFSMRQRDVKLVVLGNYQPEENNYHKQVLAAASNEVLFLGAIYDIDKVSALRFFSSFYIHGHQVGGTNPSLVESLGCGNAIIAHDNSFNRWVAGKGAVYFNSVSSADELITQLFENASMQLSLKEASRAIFRRQFQWDDVLAQYEQLLLKVSGS